MSGDVRGSDSSTSPARSSICSRGVATLSSMNRSKAEAIEMATVRILSPSNRSTTLTNWRKIASGICNSLNLSHYMDIPQLSGWSCGYKSSVKPVPSKQSIPNPHRLIKSCNLSPVRRSRFMCLFVVDRLSLPLVVPPAYLPIRLVILAFSMIRGLPRWGGIQCQPPLAKVCLVVH